ncbi:helicase C-terminal domain-containing protein [Streptomyces sp. CB01881]|uniref:helicase C-terminal domain-containing protein n=1 Tax=Streptomyces sp. CB01881 TaxID=2078691 RepID=UPI000CDC72A6|nr:helicase C-terminal domain-containing protein [Streptomyces sp. CB01881]AUY50274.1 DNA-binding protein [Streptomyces sp. CB01881]TYC73662.1 DNA-binding protein [Streptomyces sp. CB01881]
MTTQQGPQRTGKAPAGPRTLADELRSRADDDLATLLRSRPDLLNPVPGDLTQLAARLSSRASALRALERLDRFTLQVAEALAAAPDGASPATVKALLTGPARVKPHPGATPLTTADRAAVTAALPRALATLRDRALLWGPENGLRLVIAAREALAPTAANPGRTGLGPTLADATAGMSPARLQQLLASAGQPATPDPVTAVAALTALLGDRARCDALLATAPEPALRLLDRLVWGPPTGTVPDATRPVTAEDAQSPVEWLLARGLLLPSSPGSVVLPRELALHLRGGRTHRVVEPVQPEPAPAAAPRDPQAVDKAAAGQAYTAVRIVEELLDLWGLNPPPTLRAGGLGVRDLKRTAQALETTEQQTAFWLELAHTCGLLAPDGEADERWAPTPAYDGWLQQDTADRWEVLAGGWLTATRVAALTGSPDGKGKARAALGPELDRTLAPSVRRAALALLAELPPGTAATAGELLPTLRWQRPLRGGPVTGQAHATGQGPAGQAHTGQAHAGQEPAGQAHDLRDDLTAWTLAEAELLGVTGRGALASPARALLTAEADPAEVLAPLLPQPLDHVILQPDLTAIAPGPLLTPLAQALALCADIESKGGATVYRFTTASVRRALDAGRTAADLRAFLEQHSRTPVPQPLAYLIDDVARRHGILRVGAASSYLRCDDPALLNEVLADRRSVDLRLRLLAPTVLAAQAAPDVLLAALRGMGYAPAAESAEGDVLITRPDSHRTPPRTAPVPVPDGPPTPDDTLLAAAIKAIRAGDRAATAVRREHTPDPRQLPRTPAAETLAALQTAVLLGERMWIGYLNAEGLSSQRIIDPVKVEGGFVTAFDHHADELRTFALHRITGVAELEE